MLRHQADLVVDVEDEDRGLLRADAGVAPGAYADLIKVKRRAAVGPDLHDGRGIRGRIIVIFGHGQIGRPASCTGTCRGARAGRRRGHQCRVRC